MCREIELVQKEKREGIVLKQKSDKVLLLFWISRKCTYTSEMCKTLQHFSFPNKMYNFIYEV